MIYEQYVYTGTIKLDSISYLETFTRFTHERLVFFNFKTLKGGVLDSRNEVHFWYELMLYAHFIVVRI